MKNYEESEEMKNYEKSEKIQFYQFGLFSGQGEMFWWP